MSESTKKHKGLAVNLLEGFLGTDFPPEKVIANKSYYNSAYQGLAKAYGFNSFMDMYDYCMNDNNALDFIQKAEAVNQGALSQTGNKSKEKDTSDLVLETKSGMRKGKPYTSSYWTDPSKGNKSGTSSNSSEEKEQTAIVADGLYIGGKEFGKPFKTTIANSKPPKSWITIGNYKKKCFDYIYIIENDTITFMSGLNCDNNIVKIQYVSAYNKKHLVGNIFKLISKVLKESWLINYGVEFDPAMFDKYITIVPLCRQFQLAKRSNKYKATPKQLQSILGDSSWYRQ